MRGKNMASLRERFKNSWNAFMGRDPTNYYNQDFGYGNYRRIDRSRLGGYNNLKDTVSTIYNYIAVDCASCTVNHVRLDEKGNFKEIIKDDLNYALSKEANIDQTGRELIQDIVFSMLDEGYVAVIPVDTDMSIDDLNGSESYIIYTLRVAKILEWYPEYLRVEAYNDRTGQREQIMVEKRTTAVIENPFYSIMNETNSTAQRLKRVLSQLDNLNQEVSANKLNLLIQFPYSTKSKAKEIQAERRVKSLEAQLTENQYGIGYTDATEKIIQLNRPLENNLWEQAKDLTIDLFSQLGLTKSIFDGTADEKTMLNYQNRIIEPILSTIVENMERKWLSKTARTQMQAIRFFKDPFKLVPVAQIAEIADKFTRNEIMTSNEMRAKIGMQPIDDPKANELRNANLNHPDEEGTTSTVVDEVIKEK